jgi:hypothetical protein
MKAKRAKALYTVPNFSKDSASLNRTDRAAVAIPSHACQLQISKIQQGCHFPVLVRNPWLFGQSRLFSCETTGVRRCVL